MREPLFTGVGVALVTLFDDAGEVAADATAAHARRLVDVGIRGVVVAGSTGEASALSPAERLALLDAVVKEVGDEVPVWAGTGGPSARQATELTAEARAHGADAVLALSPQGARQLDAYYGAVARAAQGIPVLAYHFPSTSPPGVPVEEIAQLPVQGIKDSSGDPERLLFELAETDVSVYTGSAAQLALAGPLGCRGAVLALANAEPELTVTAFSGDIEAQRRLTEGHRRARSDFPVGLKELVADRYGTSTVARL